jgi:hypothetical protein
MIIEGMIIAGFSINAQKGIIFIRPEYESGARIFEREVQAAKAAGYLGKNILGSQAAQSQAAATVSNRKRDLGPAHGAQQRGNLCLRAAHYPPGP